MGNNWEPAFDGPPPRPAGHNTRGKFDNVRRWCKEHPDTWAMVKDVNSTTPGRFRGYGFIVEARQRHDAEGMVIKARFDMWVKWPQQ